MKNNIRLAIKTAIDAGKITLHHFGKSQTVQKKLDLSPVTIADKTSHELILKRLETTGLKVISEESSSIETDTSSYWIVDPLDGTKDYLLGSLAFTVNIALVKDNYPCLGVVFAPAYNELYLGIRGKGSYLYHKRKFKELNPSQRSHDVRIGISKSHRDKETEIFIRENNIKKVSELGSALKYCRLATGELDVVPRLVGSSEWDTAAAQVVLEGVKGQLLDWHSRKPLTYGKKGRRNPRFIAMRYPYKINDFKFKTYSSELL